MTSSGKDVSGEDLYPIRTVASLTGVNPVTLRAWERRYGLIQPKRSDSRHRFYTGDDIKRIHEILALINKGIPVSKVKEALKPTVDSHDRPRDLWELQQQQMLDAVIELDQLLLEEIYNEVVATQPINVVMERLILPLLKRLGTRWLTEQTGVAEEHFFSLFLRNKLGARFHHGVLRSDGARLLCCCLPGEQHEIGLLLFALEARAEGFMPILLGADMPLSALSPAARRIRADAIVLSCSMAAVLTEQKQAVEELVEQHKIPIFLGGPVTIGQRDTVVRSGAIPLGTDIPHALRLIGQRLHGHTHDSQHYTG